MSAETKTHSTANLSAEDQRNLDILRNSISETPPDPNLTIRERQQRIDSLFSQLHRMVGEAVCKKNTEEIRRRVEKEHRHHVPLVHKMITSPNRAA